MDVCYSLTTVLMCVMTMSTMLVLGCKSYGCRPKVALGCWRARHLDFVTPTHTAPAIAAAIELARKEGLRLPTVYNTGGYDSVKTLKLLEGFIDIYISETKSLETMLKKLNFLEFCWLVTVILLTSTVIIV